MRLELPPASEPARRRDHLRSAIIVNQLATPGLGSWMAGRRRAATGQLLLATAGFVLIVAFLGMTIVQSVRSLWMDVALASPPASWWRHGLILFAAAWLWAGMTSLQLWREARWLAARAREIPPRLTP